MHSSIKKAILEKIRRSRERYTPIAIKKSLIQEFSITAKTASRILKELVSDRQLEYTYQYGISFLEPSFSKPVRISPRVILKPFQASCHSGPQDIVISLNTGVAFGNGRHPSTRLALTGLEYTITRFLHLGRFRKKRKLDILDIGTGSGILIIAAVKMGFDSGTGIDIDACARVEALENLKLNGLNQRITISDCEIEGLNQKFDTITANLRYPTLKLYLSKITSLTRRKGFAVLSGLKQNEVLPAIEVFESKKFKCLWKELENGWGGIVLKKK